MSPRLDTGTQAGTDPGAGPEPARHRAEPPAVEALLGQVFAGEPPVGAGVAAVFRRANRLRRRRLQLLLVIGLVAAVLVAALGYALASAMVPDSVRRDVVRREVVAGAPVPAPAVDPVLMILRSTVDRDLRVEPQEPSRGVGWRQYTVLSRESGRPRGRIEISAYTAPDGICFPGLIDRTACARPERIGETIEYARYGGARDVDWQVYQAIARRVSDGRVLVVMTTGERGTGDAVAGRTPLTALQTATLAVDPALMAAFGPEESCDGPDPGCPLLIVEVPGSD